MSTRSKVNVADAVVWLRQHATKTTRDGMARYGIPSVNALGVKVGETKAYARESAPTTRSPQRSGRPAEARLPSLR
jgi:hypothetical protein